MFRIFFIVICKSYFEFREDWYTVRGAGQLFLHMLCAVFGNLERRPFLMVCPRVLLLFATGFYFMSGNPFPTIDPPQPSSELVDLLA